MMWTVIDWVMTIIIAACVVLFILSYARIL